MNGYPIALIVSWVFFIVWFIMERRAASIAFKVYEIGINGMAHQQELFLQCLEADRKNRNIQLVK